MSDVFISYKQEERERMRPIAEALRALQLDVWFDARLQPDRAFTEEIRQEMEHCRAQLVCWSPAAMRSEWVRGEAEIARQRGVLISVVIEPTTLDPPFNMHHAENLTGWAGTWSNEGWLKVVDAIGRKVGRPGLRELALLQDSLDSDRWQKWAERYPADPCAEDAWAKAEALHIESERTRLARQRDEARKRAQEREARASAVASPPRVAAPLSQAATERSSTHSPGWLTVPRLLLAFAALVVLGVGSFVAANVMESNRVRIAAAVLADDEARWTTATQANTAQAYQEYLVAEPAGVHVAEARRAVAAFDAAAWDPADKESVPSLRRYIERFPQGAHAAEAQSALGEFERVALTRARRVGTAAALTAFLEEWPESTERDAVVEERQRLESARSTQTSVTPPIVQRPAAPRLTNRGDPHDQCEEWDSAWTSSGDSASLANVQSWLGNVPSQCTNLRRVVNGRIATLQASTNNTANTTRQVCPTAEFVVFFEWDRSNLNQAAIETIDAAVNRARQCTVAGVVVVGHADTELSASYSQGISERRASVVRDALVARGIGAGSIRTEARGETDLARPTADGVREPLNRRTAVTITFR